MRACVRACVRATYGEVLTHLSLLQPSVGSTVGTTETARPARYGEDGLSQTLGISITPGFGVRSLTFKIPVIILRNITKQHCRLILYTIQHRLLILK